MNKIEQMQSDFKVNRNLHGIEDAIKTLIEDLMNEIHELERKIEYLE